MKEGLGKHYNSSGDKIYVGTYEKDQRKTGCFYFTEGWYQGDFLENKYHGRGHYHTDVIDYEGGFVNGLRSGFGKLTNFVTNVTKEGGEKKRRTKQMHTRNTRANEPTRFQYLKTETRPTESG